VLLILGLGLDSVGLVNVTGILLPWTMSTARPLSERKVTAAMDEDGK